jgi:hypothetical protein
MMRKVLREILIFLGCVSLVPAVAVAVLIQDGLVMHGLTVLFTKLIHGGLEHSGPDWGLWLKLISPYLAVQAVRAYGWSREDPRSRRWAHVYFLGLLVLIGSQAFRQAWDLFYFMWALGDIPQALPQFIEMEGFNVLVFLLCIAGAFFCLRVILNPRRAAQRQ